MTALSTISDYLTIDNVRQDKIEINIGRWTVEAIDSEMTGFIQYLGCEEAHNRQQRYRAFQSDNRVRDISTTYRLKAISPKRGRGYTDMAPLFGGKLLIRRITASDTTDRYILTLQLSINPTRFCVYQDTPTRTHRGSGRQLPNDSILFATQNQTSYQGEYALDSKDNLILKPGAKLNASNTFWEQNFRHYLSSITAYLDEEIISYQSGGFALLHHEDEYVVKKVENYWDIPVSDAVSFVKGLEPTFIALANDLSISTYSDGGLVNEGSAICLRGQFRNGERLKVYAKTGQRIRLEVEHKFTENSSLSESRRYTADSIDGLFQLFSGSAQVSTQLSNDFWCVIRRHCSLAEIGGGNALYFVKELYSIIGDIGLAGELLSHLTIQGGIPTGKLQKQWREALHDLEISGLVERHPRPISRYTIAPRFHNALSALSENPTN